MTEKMQKKLRVFYHKSIHSILNINMHKVKANRITKEQVQKRFLYIPDIIDVVHCRQLKWIGKVARMEEERAPQRLVASWCNNPRKDSRPQHAHQNSHAEAITKVIPGLPQDGRLQEWTPIAKKEQAWNSAIARWWTRATHNSRNPLLDGLADRCGDVENPHEQPHCSSQASRERRTIHTWKIVATTSSPLCVSQLFESSCLLSKKILFCSHAFILITNKNHLHPRKCPSLPFFQP
jgi:hypothetical protein